MRTELPFTISEATKILGCMDKDLFKAIDEGILKKASTKGRMKLEPVSFRKYCKDVHGIEIDRIPERSRNNAQRQCNAFSKKAFKRMKRKRRKSFCSKK